MGGDAPYIPSPLGMVHEALRLAVPRPGETLFDLGSGDGRVLVVAAKYYGLRAVGYEVDEALCSLARLNAEYNGVAHLVEVRCRSFWDADLSEADIVYAYLYSSILDKLKPLFSAMKRWSRIVTLDLPVPGWAPVDVKTRLDEGGRPRTAILYIRGVSDDPVKKHCGRRGSRMV